MDEGVASDPYAAIGGRHRQPGPCVELHMSDQDIGFLCDFERFDNLKYLWLSRNKLRRLEGLQCNFRLNSLYLSQNQLTSLVDSSVQWLVHLEVLHVDGNKLEDLFAHLTVLSRLRRLKILDLSANPLADETAYRLHVVKALPWLETLDRVKITDEERSRARHVKRALFDVQQAQAAAKEAEAARRESLRASKEDREALARALAQAEMTAQSIVERCARRVREKRILLRPHWADDTYDRRRTGHVDARAFEAVLDLYALWPHGTDEQKALVRRYEAKEATAAANHKKKKKKKPPPSSRPALSSSAAAAAPVVVDYLRFCRDVEPRGHLGRDATIKGHLADLHCRDKVPEISTCVRLALASANAIRRREHLLRTAAQRARIVGADHDNDESSSSSSSSFPGIATRASSAGDLGRPPRSKQRTPLDTFKLYHHEHLEKPLSSTDASLFRRTQPVPPVKTQCFRL